MLSLNGCICLCNVVESLLLATQLSVSSWPVHIVRAMDGSLYCQQPGDQFIGRHIYMCIYMISNCDAAGLEPFWTAKAMLKRLTRSSQSPSITLTRGWDPKTL